jgi:hypothetical protein
LDDLAATFNAFDTRSHIQCHNTYEAMSHSMTSVTLSAALLRQSRTLPHVSKSWNL